MDLSKPRGNNRADDLSMLTSPSFVDRNAKFSEDPRFMLRQDFSSLLSGRRSVDEEMDYASDVDAGMSSDGFFSGLKNAV